MLKIEAKQFDATQFFQFEALIVYLQTLNQSHYELQEIVKRLQFSCDAKEARIAELEKRMSQTVSNQERLNKNYDLTFKNIKTTINSISQGKGISASNAIDNLIVDKREPDDGAVVNQQQETKTNDNEGNNFTRDETQHIHVVHDYSADPQLSQYLKLNNNKDEFKVTQDMFTTLVTKIQDNQKEIHYLKNELSFTQNKVNHVAKTTNNHICSLEQTTNDKLKKINEDIDELKIKVASCNIMDLIKDNGDGSIDATKALVLSLESKIFTKLSIYDDKFKENENDYTKLKKNVELNKTQIEQLNSDTETLKQLKHKIDDNYSSLSNEINNLKQNVHDNATNILPPLQPQQTSVQNQMHPLGDTNVNTTTNQQQQQIKLPEIEEHPPFTGPFDDKQFRLLVKRVSDLEGYFRQYLSNSDIRKLQEQMSAVQEELKSKITTDNLSELYKYHVSDQEGINDLKDSLNLLYDDNRKTQTDLQNFYRKLETVYSTVMILQAMPKEIGDKNRRVDISKYIDQAKFVESTQSLYKELESLRKDNEEHKRILEEVVSKLAICATSKDVSELEDKMNTLLSELKLSIHKKYAEKYEMNKLIKVLETKIRQLTDENAKRLEGGENWLLAKRPLNGYKCASCEAYLDNLAGPQDYLPWNKYPTREAEKAYRMGSGFSHMLQMMNTEYVRNLDRKEINLTEADEGSFSISKRGKNDKVSLPKVRVVKKPVNLIDDIPDFSEEDVNKQLLIDTSISKSFPSGPKIMTIKRKNKIEK